MKWFSINGILTEMKRIRWPKAKDLARDSVTVFGFVAFLALFFYLCQVAISVIRISLGWEILSRR